VREETVVRQLRRKYESEGYQYFEYPTRDLIPEFLGSYRPDAIAIGPKGKIVIEVKAGRKTSNQDSLAKLAKLFEEQAEWRLRLVYAEDSQEHDAGLKLTKRQELKRLIEEAKRLEQERHFSASFVLGWSLLEAIFRHLNPESGANPKGPREVVEWLTREGYITQTESRQLRNMIPLRSALLHGDFTRAVEQSDVEWFIDQVARLEGHIPAGDVQDEPVS
jgi:uncharacterized protein YutE (UPF0331/DUF86 family)